MRATTCSSSLNGSIQGVATTALRGDARTRQELISTPMCLKYFFQTICYWNNHPTDEQTVTRRKTLPSLLW